MVCELIVSSFFFFAFLYKGDVLGSIAEFDKAIELDPRQKACRS